MGGDEPNIGENVYGALWLLMSAFLGENLLWDLGGGM